MLYLRLYTLFLALNPESRPQTLQTGVGADQQTYLDSHKPVQTACMCSGKIYDEQVYGRTTSTTAAMPLLLSSLPDQLMPPFRVKACAETASLIAAVLLQHQLSP